MFVIQLQILRFITGEKLKELESRTGPGKQAEVTREYLEVHDLNEMAKHGLRRFWETPDADAEHFFKDLARIGVASDYFEKVNEQLKNYT